MLCAERGDVTIKVVDEYLHNLFRIQPDFVYSVTRDFVCSCQIPMLVMPDHSPGHPYQTSMDIIDLAPKAQATEYPWADTNDRLSRAVNQVRNFLLKHAPDIKA